MLDCENGRFVRTNDAIELASAINELLADENFRMKPGSAACQTITNKFTLQIEPGTNLALYRRLGLKI